MNICVIGGGAAGISAASMAKRTNPDATVVICTEYEDVAYSPCGIPYVLGREIPDFERLFLAGPENYADAGIDLRTQTVVTEVDAAARTMTANGDVLPWDRLIVCTGWNYTLPDVPGQRPRGPHLRQEHPPRDGAERDAERRPQGRRARGGPARRRDGDRPGAPRHRDPRRRRERVAAGPGRRRRHRRAGAGRACAELGCDLRFGTGLVGFEGTGGKLRAVATSDGEIEADICVICTHKEPETTLARSMRLDASAPPGPWRSTSACAPRWRASTPPATCVEVPQNLTGVAVQGLTGSHAMQQGRVAGANAAGGDRRYDPVNIPWGMVGGQVQIGGASFGESLATSLGIPYVVGAANGISRARYFPGVQQVRVKLLAEPGTGRLIGGQFVGGEGIKERADFLAFALKRDATFEDLAWMENVYSPPIGALYEPLSVAAQNGMAQL